MAARSAPQRARSAPMRARSPPDRARSTRIPARLAAHRVEGTPHRAESTPHPGEFAPHRARRAPHRRASTPHRTRRASLPHKSALALHAPRPVTPVTPGPMSEIRNPPSDFPLQPYHPRSPSPSVATLTPHPSPSNRLRSLDNLLHSHPQVLIDLLIRRTRPKPRQPEHNSVRPHPLVPRHRMRRLDRHPRHPLRQH
jgi:hypothetical protein